MSQVVLTNNIITKCIQTDNESRTDPIERLFYNSRESAW